jgi:hypothetical protein
LTKARTNADNVAGDISGVTAGTGLTGGGTSGTVTLTNSMATTIDAAGDLIYGTGSDAFTRLGLGAANRVLKVNSGATAPEWAVDPTTDVVTTAGDLIYGTGADAVTRLGIGTSGQYLAVNSGATAPEWQTLNAGGMTLIQQTSATSATSLDFTSIPQTYKHLMLIWSAVNHSGTLNAFNFRFNNDNNAIYAQMSQRHTSSAMSGDYTSGGSVQADTSFVPFGYNCNHGTNELEKMAKGTMMIYNYTSTGSDKMFDLRYTFYDSQSGDRRGVINHTGNFKSASAISQINIYRMTGTGTFTTQVANSIKLYGVS